MIDYASELNPAQYEAATTLEGPVLVIAGAGSGKTRTIVYRLARLVESGVPASSILLLTFTRKAAREMLDRALVLLGQRGMGHLADAGGGLSAVQGGTFHAYAYSVLRLFRPAGFSRDASIMDSADSIAALQHCKELLQLGKGDHSFPKIQTIQSYISKCRNKEQDLESLLAREAQHILPHADAIQRMAGAYIQFKEQQALLDYDDLLFTLEELLRTRPEALAYCRQRHQYIMLDEYQDTNRVQARLAALLAGVDPALDGSGATGNILAVGDDAQSIYAFRGADVRNILQFPQLFPGTKIIRLEENYRSTQPVLDLSNAILEKAPEGYKKHLFTTRGGGHKPRIIRPMSDLSQAGIAAARIAELLHSVPAHEIAVLFRAGYQSYHLEVQLNKLGVRFRKYGGIRYTEAAHVKDVMSYVRLVHNPLDFTAFQRMTALTRGIGPRTCLKLYQALQMGDAAALDKARKKFPPFGQDLAVLESLRRHDYTPAGLFTEIVRHYAPRLEEQYPDDHPKRMQGLEQLNQIAATYADLDLFVADLSLDDPMAEEETRDCVTLSTIHSAKGLEWRAVLILDLVEERFPSRHAMVRDDDFEEERRLMYVACTRAKEHLDLFVPVALYDRGSGGTLPASPSPFVRDMPRDIYEEWQEGYTGALVQRSASAPPPPSSGAAVSYSSISRPQRAMPRHDDDPDPAMQRHQAALTAARTQSTADDAHAATPVISPGSYGYCTHKIFGRGKIVQHIGNDKCRVNFPGLGLKVIMTAYLTMED